MKHSTKYRTGFSLIELLVVIIILGGLASVVVPNLMDRLGGAKEDTVCLLMHSQKSVLDTFKMENGVYPDTEEGFGALITNPDSDKYPEYNKRAYAKTIPKDSWKTPLVYIKKGDDFEIISLGADRKEGGEGDNADILFSACNK